MCKALPYVYIDTQTSSSLEMFWVSWQMGTCQNMKTVRRMSSGVRSLGVLGGPWGSPRGTKNGGRSLGASWDGPGRPFGWFWSMGRSLGQFWEVKMLIFRLL